MTMLGKQDGASAVDGTSYIDIASFIKSFGCNPKKDLIELWKRIVFNMAISNTDDHLRNHGFIMTSKGWELSPLYDVNPVPYGEYLSLNVSESNNAIDIFSAIDVSKFYGLSTNEAIFEANKIIKTVNNNWEKIAKNYGASRREIEYMSQAFGLKTVDEE